MRKFLLFLLCVMLGIGAGQAYALETLPTPANEFMPNAPIVITGYQTSELAQNLAAVEIYNIGDKPIDLAQWSLYAMLKDGTTNTVQTVTQHTGWFLPGEHVVYAVGAKTTFSLVQNKQPAPIVTIEMRYTPSQLYRPATAVIKDQSDVPFFRTYTSTGYSTAAQPFLAAPLRAYYDDGLYTVTTGAGGVRIVEIYPYGSDCAPNDTSVLCGDYVKLFNASANEVALDGLVLRTDSSSSSSTVSNTFTLKGVLQPGGYALVSNTDGGARMALTNSGGYAWLEDAWGLARYDDTITKYESAGSDKQGYAYALTQDNAWAWTITPQPFGENIVTAPAAVIVECSEGKYRNPDTGRCRTIEEAVNALSTCEEGYERNPVTNRCRKVAVTVAATLTPCLEGQERNPTTNRCRSIASAVAELLPCEEGYERNPDTHRCRKVANADVPSASFPVTPVPAAATDMAGWWAFGGVIVLAAGYGVWEWRAEIASLARKALGIFARTK